MNYNKIIMLLILSPFLTSLAALTYSATVSFIEEIKEWIEKTRTHRK